MFHLWWRAGDADFYGETEPTAGRFSYGLIEGGGALSRILWLRRALFPRSAWVRSVYGRPAARPRALPRTPKPTFEYLRSLKVGMNTIVYALIH